MTNTPSASILFSYNGSRFPDRRRNYRAILIGCRVEVYNVRADGTENFRGYAESMSGLSGAAYTAVVCHAYGEHTPYPGLLSDTSTAWIADETCRF